MMHGRTNIKFEILCVYFKHINIMEAFQMTYRSRLDMVLSITCV